jgi:Protein of unknown function (DUF3800)
MEFQREVPVRESPGVRISRMSQKLYCYVDESGQDTRGALFVVAAVIAAEDRERVRDLLRLIEYESGKAKRKWTKATRRQRHAYMERVMQSSLLQGRLFYARFSQTTDYLPCVLHTTARALTISASGQPYQATVLIDGLQKAERPRVGQGLRQLKVAAKKVRGVRDESDEFIRLADATAGFVRDYLEGQDHVRQLYQQGVSTQILQEV